MGNLIKLLGLEKTVYDYPNFQEMSNSFDMETPIDKYAFYKICEEARMVFAKYHSYDADVKNLKNVVDGKVKKNYNAVKAEINKENTEIRAEKHIKYFRNFAIPAGIFQFLFFFVCAFLGEMEINPILAILPLAVFEIIKMLYLDFKVPYCKKGSNWFIMIMLAVSVFIEIELLKNFFASSEFFIIYLASVFISRFLSNGISAICFKRYKNNLDYNLENYPDDQEKLAEALKKDEKEKKNAVAKLKLYKEAYPELKEKYESRKELYEVMRKYIYMSPHAYTKEGSLKILSVEEQAKIMDEINYHLNSGRYTDMPEKLYKEAFNDHIAAVKEMEKALSDMHDLFSDIIKHPYKYNKH